jgi:hypothetical protein
VPDVESITTTKVTFTDSEMDNLSSLQVQLQNLINSGSPECSGEEYDLLVTNLQACLDDLAV